MSTNDNAFACLYSDYDMDTKTGRAEFFRCLRDVHAQCEQAPSFETVREFLLAMKERLDGKTLAGPDHSFVLAVYGYWYMLYPQLSQVGQPEAPTVLLAPQSVGEDALSDRGTQASRSSCLREAIRLRISPQHLEPATKILHSRGFDPAILTDDGLMNEGLWKSVIRFCEREIEVKGPAITRLLKRPAQRRHFGYTDINSGFSELESAVKKLVRPEELLGDVNWSMEKGQGNEENLRDSFTQATLSSERILFSFTNFVYGEPRETNLGYISLGSQGLLCIVVHRKARAFLPVNRVKNIQSIIELNELLEQCRKGSKESETPGLNVNAVTRRPSEVLAAKMEGAVAASSDLLHVMCDEAMDKASRLRGHSGFIFDQVALAAAGHYRLKPGTEKELPEQTGILPSDADGLIREIQENKFGEDTIWALDPWFYYCLDRTKLGDEYEVYMLAHNLKMPVGLAFTDLFLPVMMRSKDQMLTIRDRVLTALKGYAGGLQAIGVAVDGMPLEKNGFSKTTPEVATQPQDTSEPRQAKP